MNLSTLIENFAYATILNEVLDPRSNFSPATQVLTTIFPEIRLMKFYEDRAEGVVDSGVVAKTIRCTTYTVTEPKKDLQFSLMLKIGDGDFQTVVKNKSVLELDQATAGDIANSVMRAKRRTYREPEDFSEQGHDDMIESFAERLAEYYNGEVSRVGKPKQYVVSSGALGVASIIITKVNDYNADCKLQLVAGQQSLEQNYKWTEVMLLVDDRSFRFNDLIRKIDSALSQDAQEN